MKTYKQFMNESDELDEGLLYSIAIDRKLKAALNAVQSTNDINQKIDILMRSLHFSLGSLALQLQKSRK